MRGGFPRFGLPAPYGGCRRCASGALSGTLAAMTDDANLLMAEALKRVTVSGSFDPVEIGRRVGLSKPQAQLAARALANAGVLVLGFDSAAAFSPDFRKANAKPAAGRSAVAAAGRKPTRASPRRS